MKHETAFAKNSKERHKKYRNRGKVVWHGSRGVYTRNKHGAQGKAAKKAAKKMSHTKGYYRKQREGTL